jgi:hypothetical protein
MLNAEPAMAPTNPLAKFDVGGRVKTGQLGSNQNQPLLLFKSREDVLASSDCGFGGLTSKGSQIATTFQNVLALPKLILF